MSSEKGWRGGEQQLAYLLEDLSDKKVNNVLAVKSGSGLEMFSQLKQIQCYTLKFSSTLEIASAFSINKI